MTKSTRSTWPSDIVCKLQLQRDGFDSRLEPIASGIFTRWLLTRRARAHEQSSSRTAQFSVEYYLKIISVIYLHNALSRANFTKMTYLSFTLTLFNLVSAIRLRNRPQAEGLSSSSPLLISDLKTLHVLQAK